MKPGTCVQHLVVMLTLLSYRNGITTYVLPLHFTDTSTDAPDQAVLWTSDFLKSLIANRQQDEGLGGRLRGSNVAKESTPGSPPPAHGSEDSSSQTFSDLAYSSALFSPCPAEHPQKYRNFISEMTEDPRKIVSPLLKELVSRASFFRYYAERTIKTDLVEDCTLFDLPQVTDLPTLQSLKDNNVVNALSILYKALANQTAHTYYIWEQQRKSINVSCPNKSYIQGQTSDGHLSHTTGNHHTMGLARRYFEAAVNLQECMCLFSVAANILNLNLDTKHIVASVLRHQAFNPPSCSVRAVRDCQVMTGNVQLLDILSRYLRLTMSTLVGNNT